MMGQCCHDIGTMCCQHFVAVYGVVMLRHSCQLTVNGCGHLGLVQVLPHDGGELGLCWVGPVVDIQVTEWVNVIKKSLMERERGCQPGLVTGMILGFITD